MSDLNSQLESLLSSARAAREVGDVDASNAAMNALGQFVASQSNANPNALYNLDSSRGNYALMSEAQNAWLADPRNAETIRSWYAPAKQVSASNSRPRTRVRNKVKTAISTPVNAKEMTDQYIPAEGIDPNGWIPVSSMPTNLSPNELDISNLGYRRGSGRLANVFNGRDSLVTSNPYSVGSFNNLVNSTPSVEGVLNVLPDTVGVNNPEPETPFMNKPLVKQDGTLDLYDPDVPGPKLSIPLPRNISRHWNYGPFGIAWDAVGGALSYLNNLSGK